VVDGERLTWVARAQGARQGLRHDPDMGSDARLSCSSSGWAWRSTLEDDDALAAWPGRAWACPISTARLPTSLAAVLARCRAPRERGYSITADTYTLGLSALSAPVRFAGQPAFGVLTIAGPTVRFTLERMQALVPSCWPRRRSWPPSVAHRRFSSAPPTPARLPSAVGPPSMPSETAGAALPTEACDLLVVGSGAGGLSAAVTAAHLGLKVIVAEKEPQFGGTTAWSGGWMWIPGNPLAQAAGIQ